MCIIVYSCVAFEWCSSARCQEKGIHNCKIYRMIDLRVKKLTSAVFNGIVFNPKRTIEILGIREQGKKLLDRIIVFIIDHNCILERSSVLGKTCSRNEISMEYSVESLESSAALSRDYIYDSDSSPVRASTERKEAEACISVERTVKVLKEDANRACNSVRPEIGLPRLTMDDVREIWETLKTEGKVFDN